MFRFTVTVKPPKGVRSSGNIAGRVGRSHSERAGIVPLCEERIGVVPVQAPDIQCEQHGAQHAKKVVRREGRRTGKAPGEGRRVSRTDVGVCLVPVRVEGGYMAWE